MTSPGNRRTRPSAARGRQPSVDVQHLDAWCRPARVPGRSRLQGGFDAGRDQVSSCSPSLRDQHEPGVCLDRPASVASTSSSTPANGPRVAQPGDELDRQRLPVQVAGEADQVNLDLAGVLAERRVRADVRRRRPHRRRPRPPGPRRRRRRGARSARRRGSPSGSRSCGRAARRVDDGPRDRGTAGRAVPRPAATSPPTSAARTRLLDTGSPVELRAAAPPRTPTPAAAHSSRSSAVSPGPAAAEAEVVSLHDRLRPELAARARPRRSLRAEREQLRVVRR